MLDFSSLQTIETLEKIAADGKPELALKLVWHSKLWSEENAANK